MRLGIIRLNRQRLLVARQRLVKPLQLLQRNAAIGERVGIVRPRCDSAVEACQRLIKPLQLM